MFLRTLLAAVVILTACAGPSTPEEHLRELVDRAQAAASNRDVGALLELVSESYADRKGQTKRDIKRLVLAHLLRSRALHAYFHAQELSVENDRGEVTVLAGMARLPIGGIDQLRSATADLFIFELEFRDEVDGWRVTSGRWRRALPADMHL